MIYNFALKYSHLGLNGYSQNIIESFHLCIILLTNSNVGWQGKPDHTDMEEKPRQLATGLASDPPLLFWASFPLSQGPQSGEV
jgi:hypothetical protein